MSLPRILVIIALPLLLAACGLFGDEEDTPAPPAQAATPPKPTEPPLIALRPGPQTLLGFSPSDAKPAQSKPAPAPAPAAPPADAKPPTHRDDLGDDEAQSFYEGVLLTYAFDACGLPLLGETARQDIGHRIEVCPNPDARKKALRAVYRRALATAEQDPEKLRASALSLCKDKRGFLSNVMSHSQQLRFDDSGPPDCSAISPRP